jgi:hypothetical protein
MVVYGCTVTAIADALKRLLLYQSLIQYSARGLRSRRNAEGITFTNTKVVVLHMDVVVERLSEIIPRLSRH